MPGDMSRGAGCRGAKERGITQENEGTLGGNVSVQHFNCASGFINVYACQSILDCTLWIHRVYCMSLYFNKAI